MKLRRIVETFVNYSIPAVNSIVVFIVLFLYVYIYFFFKSHGMQAYNRKTHFCLITLVEDGQKHR